MPVVNGEPAYEGIMGGNWQEVQRFLFWTSLTCGAAGHTYGAQGIWAMSSRDEPFTGTTMNWGDGFWQDVMHYAGSGQVALGRRFFERYPWQLFEPRPLPEVEKLGRIASFATGIPGSVWVFYYASSAMDGIFQGCRARRSHRAGRGLPGDFFNPRTGAEVNVGSFSQTPRAGRRRANLRWGLGARAPGRRHRPHGVSRARAPSPETSAGGRPRNVSAAGDVHPAALPWTARVLPFPASAAPKPSRWPGTGRESPWLGA